MRRESPYSSFSLCLILSNEYWSHELPRWLSGKEFVCQCRRCRRHRVNPCIRKILWRRKWQSTPVFLLGESHGLSVPHECNQLTQLPVWLVTSSLCLFPICGNLTQSWTHITVVIFMNLSHDKLEKPSPGQGNKDHKIYVLPEVILSPPDTSSRIDYNGKQKPIR